MHDSTQNAGLLAIFCAVGVVGLIAWLLRSRREERILETQRQVDDLHAEIAHVDKVSGTDEAIRIVDLAYRQQLEELDEDQQQHAERMRNNPVELAKYLQSVVDQDARRG